MSEAGLAHCRASIAHHSKSFALASRLFSQTTSDRAAVVYAWCRRADDGVDRAPPAEQPAALERLRRELDEVYGEARPQDLELAEFQTVVRDCGIPRTYPEELLAGMEMDVVGTRYDTTEQLLLYCHRVAGVVGLMMCHVMGLRERAALRQAAHLGLAMQLTNISRDVLEDWEMGRLYLPGDLLERCGAKGLADRLADRPADGPADALTDPAGQPFPDEAADAVAAAVQSLLRDADEYYRSGDRGLFALPWRCALAVRAARHVYAEIGRRVESRGCDVRAGRAIVPGAVKLGLVARSLGSSLAELPRRARHRFRPVDLDPARGGPLLRFPQDVLPI